MNVFRAVENRVAIARAAPTGISAFISPAGEVVGEVRDARGNALFVPGVLVRDIPLAREKTFYTLHGDVFAYGAIAFAVLAVLATWISDHSASETKG
jgi:apolipoprotein N-acyltransferase